MINPQLLEYIRAQRTQGLSKEAIIKALAQGGWTPQDAQEAFMAIEGVQTPPPPPPAMTPPGPVAPRTIVPPIQAQPAQPVQTMQSAPIQPMQPPTMVITPQPMVTPAARPAMAASEIATAPHLMKKKSHWLLYTLLVILLLVVAAGAALWYFAPTLISNLIPNTPFTPQTSQQTPTDTQTQQTPIEIVPTTSLNASTTVSTTTGSTTTGR